MPALELPKRYPTVVKQVSEVALTGGIDPALIERIVGGAGLHPQIADGRAQLLVMACSSRFKGKRFSEFSLSALVTNEPGGTSQDGAYLLTAFNSVRFFAWVERVFFKTPYAHAAVTLDAEQPATAGVSIKGDSIIELAMGAGEREEDRGDPLWEGPIHLAPLLTKKGGVMRHFFGRLEGASTIYAFDASEDRITVTPRDEADPLTLLQHESFTPHTWQLRTGGVHARTKTLKRRYEHTTRD